MLFIIVLLKSYQIGARIPGFNKLPSGPKTRTSISRLDILNDLMAYSEGKEVNNGVQTVPPTVT